MTPDDKPIWEDTALLRPIGSPLASAGLDLSALGAHLLAPFETRRLRNARVVWRNPRWLLDQGVDLLDPSRLELVDRWLIERFAFNIPCPQDPPSAFDSESAVFHADRYGGPSGSIHGGSGRCGFRDGLLVKGIGRTPLVAPNADYWHGNGFLPLSEAIHEAIGAEICHAESPNRAVPILAIIAAGVRCHDPDGAPGEERALSIRPAFIRIAHFQRSIFFGRSGWAQSDQAVDDRRVEDVLRAVWGGGRHGRKTNLPAKSNSPAETLDKLARQFAFSRCHRLWPSTFSASNFTVDGASLDHGSFKATPDWSSAEETPGLPRFGGETRSLASLAKSLAFLCQKYLGLNLSHDALTREALSVLTRAFDDEIKLALGLAPGTDEAVTRALAAPFHELWRRQQRVRSFLGNSGRRDWIHPYLRDPTLSPRRVCSDGWALARAFEEALEGLRASGHITGAQSLAIQAAAARFTRPRPELYHHHLRGRARRLVNRIQEDRSASAGLVRGFIEGALTSGRRLWRDLPPYFTVEGQACAPHWSVACGRDDKGRPAAWVEATALQGRAHVFGQSVSAKAFPASWKEGVGLRVAGRFTMERPFARQLRLPTGETLRLPRMRPLYVATGDLPAED